MPNSENNEEECANAYSNPKCPYLAKINQHSCDVTQIKNALVGVDYQGGLVSKVQRLDTFMRITVFITSVSITAVIGLTIKVLLGV